MSIYDFEVKKIDGTMTNLKDYEGKVILIINSATHCGFTKQYIELEEIYLEYKDQGFVILDFPCNQFADQAPEDIIELHEYCVSKYHIQFPQFNKVDVNGENADPLFTYLKEQTGTKHIKWNFYKFLVDRDGTVLKKYNSTKRPIRIKKNIEELL